jgi:hypothetical protein
VFFFSSKNNIFTGQEKQNTKDIIENHVFSMVRILKWLPNLIEATFRRKNKTRTPILPKYWGKNFEVDWPSRLREKRGKLRVFLSKIGFEKNSKQ